MSDKLSRPVVIKVGGSLYDLPQLGSKLQQWLDQLLMHKGDSSLFGRKTLLVPGGGPLAEAVRQFDQKQRLDADTSHWLAVQALSIAARFLANVLAPGAGVAEDLAGCTALWEAKKMPILDPYHFLREDNGQPASLPHSWAVTSDSIAARFAQAVNAQELILLKSVSIPEEYDWSRAAKDGFVDEYFPQIVRAAFPNRSLGTKVTWVNFREWSSLASGCGR